MPSGGYFWLRQKCAPSGPTGVSRGLMSRPVIWLHQGCVYSNHQLGSLKYAHGELKDPKCLEVISKLKVQELYKEPPHSLDPETSNSQVTPVMTFVSPLVSTWEQLFMPLRQTTASYCVACSSICICLVVSWLDSGCAFLAGMLWRKSWVLFILSNQVAQCQFVSARERLILIT